MLRSLLAEMELFLDMILVSSFGSVMSGFAGDRSQHSTDHDETVYLSLPVQCCVDSCQDLPSKYTGLSHCHHDPDCELCCGPLTDELKDSCIDDPDGDDSCSVILPLRHSNCNSSLSCDCEPWVALNMSEFECVDEGAHLYKGLYHDMDLNSSRELFIVCSNVSQSEASSIPYEIAIYLASSVSILGCSPILVTFCLFKELRTLPAKIVVIRTTINLISDIFLILHVSEATEILEICEAVAIFLHFSSLSEISWNTILFFEVCHSFYHASRLIPVTTDGITRKFVAYSVIAWSIPLLIVSVSVIVNYTTPDLVLYGTDTSTGEGMCWITDVHSTIVYFIPIIIAILVQLILFALSGYFLISSRRKVESVSSGTKDARYIRVLFAIFFVSNVLWILGIVAVLLGLLWVWIFFLVLLTFQGFIIFFVFYGTKKVWALYIVKFSKKNRVMTPS